ncbi:hypothetical protein BGZ58_000417 [Dissophora ornata]|nr:hypothetical protein BGZ58_000417 [Dissophora ornata]
MSKKSPLNLSELRVQIAQYTSVNDAIACAQVCKNWTDDFTARVWSNIDFNVHTTFKTLDPQAIHKNGHLIRVINNLEDGCDVDVLQCSTVSNLRTLKLLMQPNSRFQAHCCDIIRRNNSSLIYIDLSVTHEDHNNELFFAVDQFAPSAITKATSQLTTLKIQGLTLTRDAFSSLLRSCPALEHPRIKRLYASIMQVLKPSSKSPDAPSLLIHFPALQTWNISESSSWPTREVSAEDIKREISQYCPKLTAIHTETPAYKTVFLLRFAFGHLKEVCISHEEVSPELIMTIITRRETLEHVQTTLPYPGFYDQDEVPEIDNSLQDPNWMIQMIPQLCSNLTSIHLYRYEINMDEVDRTNWTCSRLTSLRIRIQDLDTKEKIDRALRMWIDGCYTRKGLTRPNSMGTSDFPAASSIETRVANFLIKFDQLASVWLGTKVYRV